MNTEVTDTFSSSHRLTLNKTRLLVRAAKGFMSKYPSRGSETGSEGDNESMDYLPLVSSSSLGPVGVAWSLQGSRGGSPRIFLLLSLTPCPVTCSEMESCSVHPCLFLELPTTGWCARASLCACHPLQVSLQLACGAFLLNSAFCDAVNIPMEKLKWTSPFACHRLSLSPSGSYSTKRNSPSLEHKMLNSSQQLLVPSGQGKGPSTGDITRGAVLEDTGRLRHLSGSAAESICRALKAEQELSPPAITIRRFSSPAECQADSGRGWDTDGSEVQALLSDVELQQQTEPEGMLWATAVALAWLEHSSASYFIEWELVAAKASLWLSGQDFPEGSSLATVKAAAQQLFVLLRHWDENLEFNLLCYNPGSV